MAAIGGVGVAFVVVVVAGYQCEYRWLIRCVELCSNCPCAPMFGDAAAACTSVVAAGVDTVVAVAADVVGIGAAAP